jgi:hypothetical protein
MSSAKEPFPAASQFNPVCILSTLNFCLNIHPNAVVTQMNVFDLI